MLQLNNAASYVSYSYQVSWFILVGRQLCLPPGTWEALSVPGLGQRDAPSFPIPVKPAPEKDGQSPKQRGLEQWLFLQKVLQMTCYSLDDRTITKMPGNFPIMLLYVRKVTEVL